MGQDMIIKKDQLPDYMRKYAPAKIGNIDTTDLVMPRVKLLQALSPELDKFDNANPGRFWHTVASQDLGSVILGIPIVIRKSFVLWAPRDDSRGMLAKASDGIHWDVPNLTITLKPKGSSGPMSFDLKNTVAESGLDQFGLIPGDPNSVPVASLTYNMLWFFPDHPDLSPAVMINTRSSVNPMRTLLAKIRSKENIGIAHYLQIYQIEVEQQRGPAGNYFNYNYTGEGYADESLAETTSYLFKQYDTEKWVASDEGLDVAESEGRGGSREEKPTSEKMASKFC